MPAMVRGPPSTMALMNCGNVLFETNVARTSTSATVAFLSASASACTVGSSELGAVRSVEAVGGELRLALTLPIPVGDYVEELAGALGPVLAAAGIDLPVRLSLGSEIRAHAVQRQLKPLDTISNIVAVASGKG